MEGKLCDQIQPTEQALAEKGGEDGDSTVICGRGREGRYADVVGFQERLPAVLTAPGRNKLRFFQIQWVLLSLYCPSVWLGSVE